MECRVKICPTHHSINIKYWTKSEVYHTTSRTQNLSTIPFLYNMKHLIQCVVFHGKEWIPRARTHVKCPKSEYVNHKSRSKVLLKSSTILNPSATWKSLSFCTCCIYKRLTIISTSIDETACTLNSIFHLIHEYY